MSGRNLAVLLVLAVVATVLAGPAATPAAADDRTGAIIVGAIIGGLIGAALGDNDRDCHRYRAGAPYYRYDQPRCEWRTPPWAPYNHGYRDGWQGDRDRRDGGGYRPYGGHDGRDDYRYDNRGGGHRR